jgi:hypothetical protein
MYIHIFIGVRTHTCMSIQPLVSTTRKKRVHLSDPVQINPEMEPTL